jgi:cadmium resistance protein CadD (predicted permease)
MVLFATTNIDDILLLSAFFADRTLRPAAVVVGQFAGIAVLTIVSGVARSLRSPFLTVGSRCLGLPR